MADEAASQQQRQRPLPDLPQQVVLFFIEKKGVGRLRLTPFSGRVTAIILRTRIGS